MGPEHRPVQAITIIAAAANLSTPDRVFTIIQASIIILELTQLGKLRLHRGILRTKYLIHHLHLFTERAWVNMKAKNNFRTEFQP